MENEFVKENEKCEICGHDWFFHDYPENARKRHLVGGWEYAPIWCECAYEIPLTALDYLEYKDIVNKIKNLKVNSGK